MSGNQQMVGTEELRQKSSGGDAATLPDSGEIQDNKDENMPANAGAAQMEKMEDDVESKQDEGDSDGEEKHYHADLKAENDQGSMSDEGSDQRNLASDRSSVEAENDDGNSDSSDENVKSNDEGSESNDEGSEPDNEGSELDNKDSESNDEGSDSEENDDGPSQYELLRLERIKRNQQYLARLGLEADSKKPNLASQPTRRKRKPKESIDHSIKRSSLSRRTKEQPVNYAEPTSSVAKLIEGSGKITKTKKPKREPKPPGERKPKHYTQRMERFIYLEFKRIQSEKGQNLKLAEKSVKAAEKELKYWQKRVETWQAQEERRQEAENARRQRESELLQLGGTAKDLLSQVDSRWSDLIAAAEAYDQEFESAEKRRERELKRIVNEQKLKLLDSIDRFPKALKESNTLLNSVLLQRCPKDPPLPRRSTRNTVEETQSPQPVKGRKKKLEKKIPEQVHDTGDSLRNDGLSENGDFDDGEDLEKNDDSQAKRRKNARNVGGWVSPKFAEAISRTWLDQDIPCDAMDYKSFVPQVGDTVLYYPYGHWLHLQSYPDYLGKKTRSVLRIPLWEKAAAERDEANGAENSPWWCSEWLDEFRDRFGRYPLICRVERTHAEFPPDPTGKIVRKNEGSGVVKLYWKDPKDTQTGRQSSNSVLHLAVSLRPLTPLLPPKSGATQKPLCPPPCFSAVTFPTELKPFILPFGVVYSVANSFRLNEVVRLLDETEHKYRINEFSSLNGSYGSTRIEERAPEAQAIVSRLGKETEVLEGELKRLKFHISLRDALLVLETLKASIEGSQVKEAETEDFAEKIDFLQLVRQTLPLWEDVSLIRNLYDRKKVVVSSWELMPWSQKNPVFSPLASIDESLASKLECAINAFLGEVAGADVFQWPISEEDAPSYSCAVPLQMSLSKILQRLKPQTKPSSSCYYRWVDSLLADINALQENCLLYNSPDSDVVELAVSIVSSLKSRLLTVAKQHIREKTEARKKDEERRAMVMRYCKPENELEGNNEESQKVVPEHRVRNPFKHMVQQEWLQTLSPQDAINWFPQAGDEVLYSRKRHAAFVEGHFPSLEAYQCVLPSKQSCCSALNTTSTDHPSSADLSEWTTGRVVWSRACFPKEPSKKSDDDANTFPSCSTLLSIGIQFQEEGEIAMIFWRPCIFANDSNVTVCSACGVSSSESFLQPTPRSSEENNSHQQEDILKCFSFLKRRCIRGVAVSHLDPQLSKSNVKEGYMIPTTKIKPRSYTSFGDYLNPTSQGSQSTENVATRGVSKRPTQSDAQASLLAKRGYMPPWVLQADTPGAAYEGLRKSSSFSPWPKLSLELIHIRMLNGFYRSRLAIQNDIIEAYVVCFFLTLSSEASRRKSPLSLKKVARALSKETSGSTTVDGSEDPERIEESQRAAHFVGIRELFATAISCVMETDTVLRIFGIEREIPHNETGVGMNFEDPEEDPIRAEARQKIAYILRAADRDECKNNLHFKEFKNSLPVLNVKVQCNGETVSGDSIIEVIPYAEAMIHEKDMKAILYVDGKRIYGERDVSFSEGDRSFSSNFDCKVEIKSKALKEQQNHVALLPSRRFCIRNGSRIQLSSDIYENNDDLVRLLFSRPGRTQPCARCLAYRRSLFYCRVRRGHSNIDFDWLSVFSGSGGVDGLLSAITRGAYVQNESCSTRQESGQSLQQTDPPNLALQPSSKETSPKGGGDVADNIASPEEPQTITDGGRPPHDGDALDDITDPRPLMELAQKAFDSSQEVLRDAETFAEAPVRLSKDFVSKEFPIDDSDGHFMYCIICGLSGDLICCEGCPNVFHCKCAEIEDIPEGDWFCDECQLNTENESADHGRMEALFGRVDFDNERLLDLDEMIETLRAARPDRLRIRSTKDKEQGDGNESDAASLAKPHRRVSLDQDALSTSSITGTKRRGRPPKRAQEERLMMVNAPPSSPAATTRKRGRPPKVVIKDSLSSKGQDPSLMSARRRPGRPPKRAINEQLPDDDGSPFKRRRGRPPKRDREIEVSTEEFVKRSANIIQIDSDIASTEQTRRLRRSKKDSMIDQNELGSVRRRGRPRKESNQDVRGIPNQIAGQRQGGSVKRSMEQLNIAGRQSRKRSRTYGGDDFESSPSSKRKKATLGSEVASKNGVAVFKQRKSSTHADDRKEIRENKVLRHRRGRSSRKVKVSEADRETESPNTETGKRPQRSASRVFRQQAESAVLEIDFDLAAPETATRRSPRAVIESIGKERKELAQEKKPGSTTLNKNGSRRVPGKRGSKAKESQSSIPSRPTRNASLRTTQKRHLRSRGRILDVEVISEVDSIGKRNAAVPVRYRS